MSIYEQIKSILENQYEKVITGSEIKEILKDKFDTKPSSVLLSDYCYNRYNNGIRFDKHLFEYLDRDIYRYLGENYPYTGLIYHKPSGESSEKVVGEWINGTKNIYKNDQSDIKISSQQIQKLYREYINILHFEMALLGCKPTELRHLIGRLGEFICVLETKGQLAKNTNQQGFDVISKGRKISVKTTAQYNGFIQINKNTFKDFDDLFIVQYIYNDFKTIFYGPKERLGPIMREYKNTYEIDIIGIKKLYKKYIDV